MYDTLADHDTDWIPRQRSGHQRAQAEGDHDPRAGCPGQLQQVERGEASPDSGPWTRFADAPLSEAKYHRQQYNDAEEEDHPGAVLALAEAAEEAQGVGGGCKRKEKRGRHPKKAVTGRANSSPIQPKL